MEDVFSETKMNDKEITIVNDMQSEIYNNSDKKKNIKCTESSLSKYNVNISKNIENSKEINGDVQKNSISDDESCLMKNIADSFENSDGCDKIDSESNDNVISLQSKRIKARRSKLCGKFDKIFRKNKNVITDASSSESEERNDPVKNVRRLSSDSDSEINYLKDHVSNESEHVTKPPSPRGQRMSAKQAMENMQKIKSEANRMLRTKNASLPYHQPSQISLRDIIAVKIKKQPKAVNSDSVFTETIDSNVNICMSLHPNEIDEAVSDLPHVNFDAQCNSVTEISESTKHSEINGNNVMTDDTLLVIAADIEKERYTEFIGDKINEENLFEDLIKHLENEDTMRVDHPKPEFSDSAPNIKPSLAVGEVIDLSGEASEVLKTLSGVDLLREKFLKQQSMKTTGELERENEKKMRNRAFDLKQSLGEIIVQRRIQEWISRETETVVKKLEDEDIDDKSNDGLPDEEHIEEAMSDVTSDTDSTSSNSDVDDGAGEVDEDLKCSERKLNRVIINADSSDEGEIESNNKKLSHSKPNENIDDIGTCEVANEEMTESDFHLRLDTEPDDVLFSPNKTFIESPKVGSKIDDSEIVHKEKESIETNQVQEFPIEESQTVDESQNRSINDDSELMDLCTGKFMDGLVQESSILGSSLPLSTSPTSSFTKNANQINNSRKIVNGLSQWLNSSVPVLNESRDNIEIGQPYVILNNITKNNQSDEDNNDSIGVRNQKGKLVIMSSDEKSSEESEKEEQDRENPVKNKKLLKRKDRKKAARKLTLQISDDDISSSEDDIDESDNAASITSAGNKGEVEYDSEENEIVTNEKPKNSKAAEFFENEAELTSEDEWKGSGDEDEADLDTLEREEGDDDKFNERKMKKQLERIHMRQILDEDKREVRLLQEILLEDGDLNGRSRERKFKWKDFDWTADPAGNANEEGSGSQCLEELECEAIWRKQRHEREAYLRELKIKEKSTNGKVKDDLEDRISHITSHTEVTSSVAVNKIAVPSPKKNSLLIIKRTSATFPRASTSLSRLSALLQSSSSNTDEILSKKVDNSSKNLVFAKSSPPASKCQDTMTKKRKTEEMFTPESKKACSSNNVLKVRRGLLDLIDL